MGQSLVSYPLANCQLWSFTVAAPLGSTAAARLERGAPTSEVQIALRVEPAALASACCALRTRHLGLGGPRQPTTSERRGGRARSFRSISYFPGVDYDVTRPLLPNVPLTGAPEEEDEAPGGLPAGRPRPSRCSSSRGEVVWMRHCHAPRRLGGAAGAALPPRLSRIPAAPVLPIAQMPSLQV